MDRAGSGCATATGLRPIGLSRGFGKCVTVAFLTCCALPAETPDATFLLCTHGDISTSPPQRHDQNQHPASLWSPRRGHLIRPMVVPSDQKR